jgi:small subunit ribosomal protein S17
MSEAQTEDGEARRGLRKSMVGVVVSAKMDKTRRVEVERRQPHPRYGKYLKARTVCYVHDENNETKVGDRVRISETRPLSKTKRWRLVEIVAKAAQPVEDVTAQG